MLHHIPGAAAAPVAQDLRATAAVGDIIRWPLDGGEGLGLVVEVETIGGWPVLCVAPGLSDHGQPVGPGILRLVRMDEVRGSGLTAPVRFALGLRVSVALSHPGLEPSVMGHLCRAALARLHAERARIHALQDIAAARREERRATRRGDTRTGWRPAPRPVPAAATEAR